MSTWERVGRTSVDVSVREPPLRVRFAVAGTAILGGAWCLVATGVDDALSVAFIAFGAVSGLTTAFDAAVVAADRLASESLSGGPAEPPASGVLDELARYQGAVITVAGTVIGLLAAFAERPLPPAAAAALVALAACAVFQLAVQSSRARASKVTQVRRLGLYGDITVAWLLTFGLVALVASLIVT